MLPPLNQPQVVIFQEYDNINSVPIEAKYVFPLEDSAAVCGFEAFIADKHIVGVVKEKEQAHREYREAISKGHGAYLMDEEAPVSRGRPTGGGAGWVGRREYREVISKGHGAYLMDEEAPVSRGWVRVGRREGEGKEQTCSWGV